MRSTPIILTVVLAVVLQASADSFHPAFFPKLVPQRQVIKAKTEQKAEEKQEEETVATRLVPLGDSSKLVQNPEGLPEGYECVEKEVEREVIEFDDELQCHHVQQESCFKQVNTLYKQSTVKECKEVFKKDCFFQYVAVAKERNVKICQDSFSRNCAITGPEVCTDEQQTVCETTYPEHEVEEDEVACIDMVVPWCETNEAGIETCINVPKKNCTLNTVTVTKVTPLTDCKQERIRVCGPETCPLEKGDRVCRDEVRTVVTEVPEETCDIIPKKECNDVIKIIPTLKTGNHCETIPKEVCTKVRVNPRKVTRTELMKWCGSKDDLLDASLAAQEAEKRAQQAAIDAAKAKPGPAN